MKVIDMVSEITCDKVTAGKSLRELGMDDIDIEELSINIEDELGVHIPPGELDRCADVDEIVAMLGLEGSR